MTSVGEKKDLGVTAVAVPIDPALPARPATDIALADIPGAISKDFDVTVSNPFTRDLLVTARGFRGDFVSLGIGNAHHGHYSLIINHPEQARAVGHALIAAADWTAGQPAAAPEVSLSVVRDLLNALESNPDDLDADEYEAIVSDAKRRARDLLGAKAEAA